MKKSSLYVALLAVLLPLAAQANPVGYVSNTAGTIVRNNYNECVHDSAWTPALAIAECDPSLVKMPAKAEAKPVAASAPVAVAPTPVAVVAEVKAAPAPAQQKTMLVEKAVRLEGATFASGSAKLLSSADMKLNEVVEAANKYPEANLVVSGHTDNRGRPESNQIISNLRADAVKAWLVNHGVAANRISTAGFGQTQPIADNNTSAGRAANRRVEVKYAIREEAAAPVSQ